MTLPTSLSRIEIIVLGDVHDYGGTLTLWGSWKRIGWRLIRQGLLTLICSERRDGRTVVHVRLHTEELDGVNEVRTHGRTDIAEIADLAARCSAAVRLAAETSKQLGRTVHPCWRSVPKTVPPPTWPVGAKTCGACFCNPDKPCTVRLDDGCGTGCCVPAGVFGMQKCSACTCALEVVDAEEQAQAAGGPAFGAD
jgi:hypothetical protein